MRYSTCKAYTRCVLLNSKISCAFADFRVPPETTLNDPSLFFFPYSLGTDVIASTARRVSPRFVWRLDDIIDRNVLKGEAARNDSIEDDSLKTEILVSFGRGVRKRSRRFEKLSRDESHVCTYVRGMKRVVPAATCTYTFWKINFRKRSMEAQERSDSFLDNTRACCQLFSSGASLDCRTMGLIENSRDIFDS